MSATNLLAIHQSTTIWVKNQIETSQDEKVKKAFIAFLFQMQHYNAGFEPKSLEIFNYPKPFFHPIERSGYFRTDHFQHDFYKKALIESISDIPLLTKAMLKYIFVGHCRIMSILKDIARQQTPNIIFFDFQQKAAQNSLNDNSIGVLLRDSFHLEVPVDAIEKLFHENKKVNNLWIIISTSIESADVGILLPIKATKTKKGKISTKHLSLEKIEILRHTIFSALRMAGGSTDRFAYSTYCATTQCYEQALKANFASQEEHVSIEPTRSWSDCITALKAINESEGIEHQGKKIYCQAVLFWDKTVINKTPFPCEDLLARYVAPWLDGTFPQWAKGYQNLCEIVILALRYEEPTLTKAQESMKQALPSYLSEHNPSATLFPYAMSGFWAVINSSIKQVGEREKRVPEIYCLCQSYFEMQYLLNRHDAELGANVVLCHRIEDVPKNTDILIIDIHPNNAARKMLIQNDLQTWIESRSEDAPPLTLILDLTMNHLYDDKCEKVFESLSQLLKDKRVRVHVLQSLAKLVQLGADNFSGGLVLSINADLDLELCSPPCSVKMQYFSYLLGPGKELIRNYINLVRTNTNVVYQKLDEMLDSLANLGIFSPQDKNGSWQVFFVPISRTMNTDAETTYVALNFSPLFKALKIPEDKQEEVAKLLYKSLRRLSQARKCPITFRQSFGFGISNITLTAAALRFSIGIESVDELEKHIDLIKNWSYAILLIASRSKAGEGGIESFKKRITETFNYLDNFFFGKKFELLLREKNEVFIMDGIDYEESGQEFALQLNEGAPSINDSPTQGEIPEAEDISGWIQFFALHREFFLTSNQDELLYLKQENPLSHIYGFSKENEASYDYRDPNRNLNFRFSYPDFALTYQSQNYTKSQVTFSGELLGLGIAIVSLNKLNREKTSDFFNLCINQHIDIGKINQEGIFLVFKKPIETWDYDAERKRVFEEGSWGGLSTFLNTLYAQNDGQLLPDRNWTYRSTRTNMQILNSQSLACYHLGYDQINLQKSFAGFDIDTFSKPFKRAFCHGIFNAIIKTALCPEKQVAAEDINALKKCLAIGHRVAHNWDAETWITSELFKYLEAGHDTERLGNYFELLSPYIKQKTFPLFSSGYGYASMTHSFYKVAMKIKSFAPVLIEKYDASRKKSLTKTKALDEPNLSKLVELYVSYKYDETVCTNLKGSIDFKKIQREMRVRFLAHPNFYHQMFPSEFYDLDPHEVCFLKSNQVHLREFFNLIYGNELIHDLPKEEAYSVLRWACILDQETTWGIVLAWFIRNKLDASFEDEASLYIDLLNPEHPKQHKLIEILKKYL